MSKKKWAFVILCLLLIAGYFKFFYKTYSESAVAGTADCIVAFDVKRITNTVIWNAITTPSQWKKISYSSSDEINWKDMITIPDYFFIFHCKDQPLNAWYAVLEIKNENDFEKGLVRYHFEKGISQGGLQEYSSADMGMDLIRSENKILLGNAAEDKAFIRQTAAELFSKKQFIERRSLAKNIQAASHLSIQVKDSDLLQEDAIIKANFDKGKIDVEAMLTPKKEYTF